MTPLIESLYTTHTTVSSTGEVIEIHSEISREEGRLLHDLIANDPSIKRTLEVGCAYGLSSLHICEALRGRPGAHHTIVDPFQMTDWRGLGVQNLDRSGIDFYQLVEEKSEFALPRLVQTEPGTFDFIFIDGWHTVDQTMVDAFFSLRLLRTGGVLVLHDCDRIGIDRIVSYLEKYPCLRVLATLDRPPAVTLRGKVREALGGPIPQFFLPEKPKERFRRKRSRIVALKKIGDDDRPHDWYAPF
jgi:predicted O-methyltransferase YrrM